MSVGMRDTEEEVARESERLSKHVKVTEGSGGAPNTDFHFVIKGLPASKGLPVIILINGQEVFRNEGENGEVNAKFSSPIERGFGNNPKVTLKIEEMGFENTKQFNLHDGFYIGYEAGPSGMKIRHENKPFE
eukprot:TRINITY_DN2096_c0_g1_i1.p1 TRINITY_DN2096_c0_g1~~TRINITY_DN2096_c0_g1_i1.p1  ORF type:complete len:132 (-),score=31.19 TRINITY_DN2096_c0_g1_i1:53-448(-)